MTDRSPDEVSLSPLSPPPPTTDRVLSRLERLDIAVIHALSPWYHHPLTKVADTVGSLGDEPPVFKVSALTLAAGLVLRKPRLARAGVRMMAAHGLAVALKSLGKHRIDRSRPSHMLETGNYLMAPGRSTDKGLQSFPSGHSAGSIAAARAAMRELPEARLALQGVAATIAAMQVPRRAHFPTDVIAGLAVGVAAEAITNLIWRRLFR